MRTGALVAKCAQGKARPPVGVLMNEDFQPEETTMTREAAVAHLIEQIEEHEEDV
jgi:hypothetical protein